MNTRTFTGGTFAFLVMRSSSLRKVDATLSKPKSEQRVSSFSVCSDGNDRSAIAHEGSDIMLERRYRDRILSQRGGKALIHSVSMLTSDACDKSHVIWGSICSLCNDLPGSTTTRRRRDGLNVGIASAHHIADSTWTLMGLKFSCAKVRKSLDGTCKAVSCVS